MVVARQRELNRISQKKGDLLPESSTEFEQQPGESIRVRLEETQDELENAQALLSMERQRVRINILFLSSPARFLYCMFLI